MHIYSLWRYIRRLYRIIDLIGDTFTLLHIYLFFKLLE
jgi:hypothetical protein